MQQKSAQDIVKIIEAILDVEQSNTGDNYFKKLVENIAHHLNVKYCFIGRPEEKKSSKIKTHVVWAGKQFVDNFIYDLKDTPCEIVFHGKRIGIYPENVAKEFPNDELLVKMGVKSYLGAPIVDNDNNILGLIVVLDDKPIKAEDTDYYSAIMELIAGRVGSEIERNDLQVNLQQQVTERTAELNQRMKELERTRYELLQSEKMASLGRLVAGFAHELNTPIGVAVGSASVLENKASTIIDMLSQDEVDGDTLDAILVQFSEATRLIVANLKRASGLVNSFKRTAVDQSSEDVRQFDVKLTLEDLITTLHNRFKQAAITIHLIVPENLKVYSIPGSLDQIMTNLLLNSLDHGFSAGQDSGDIYINATLNQEQLHITYRDTGKGIASDTLAKIFEPFFTTNRSQGGSGLGLYISYNLVTNQLQGDIQCQSIEGEGATFKLTFPVQLSSPIN
jgi:signal transduction histidine kinase